jgi:hypothetical protein
MPKKNDRGADDRALSKNAKKSDATDRVKGLGRLIGAKDPKKEGK